MKRVRCTVALFPNRKRSLYYRRRYGGRPYFNKEDPGIVVALFEGNITHNEDLLLRILDRPEISLFMGSNRACFVGNSHWKETILFSLLQYINPTPPPDLICNDENRAYRETSIYNNTEGNQIVFCQRLNGSWSLNMFDSRKVHQKCKLLTKFLGCTNCPKTPSDKNHWSGCAGYEYEKWMKQFTLEEEDKSENCFGSIIERDYTAAEELEQALLRCGNAPDSPIKYVSPVHTGEPFCPRFREVNEHDMSKVEARQEELSLAGERAATTKKLRKVCKEKCYFYEHCSSERWGRTLRICHKAGESDHGGWLWKNSYGPSTSQDVEESLRAWLDQHDVSIDNITRVARMDNGTDGWGSRRSLQGTNIYGRKFQLVCMAPNMKDVVFADRNGRRYLFSFKDAELLLRASENKEDRIPQVQDVEPLTNLQLATYIELCQVKHWKHCSGWSGAHCLVTSVRSSGNEFRIGSHNGYCADIAKYPAVLSLTNKLILM